MSNIIQKGGIIYIQQSGNDIQYQSNSTSGTWTNITSFPVTFVNSYPVAGNILTISLITNITIIISTGYFICGSSYITFDGTGKTITISNVSAYLGLIRNGTSSVIGYSNVIVKNINSAISGSSTLADSGAYICQGYFGKSANNIIVNNCSNSGTFNGDGSGSICGEFVADNGTIIISNCLNSGLINSNARGGICGRYLGQNGGIVSILNCTNSGIINGRGGICGNFAGYNGGTVSISNCSNTGEVNGNFYTGGICGNNAGDTNGKVTITNCSNSGAISGGLYAGGICGGNVGNGNGTISIANCSNTGEISGQYAGGITGSLFGINSNNLCVISNCYSIGEITGSNAGGITGALVGYNNDKAYTPKILIQNCYSLGNIATTTGGICGGTDGSSYKNTPIVNITNCYTSYDSIADSGSQYIATSLPIKSFIILTNVYSSLTNAWSDTNASSALSGALNIYRNSRLYKYYSNFGEVWYSNQNNTPFSFTSDLDISPRRQKRE